MRIINNIKSVLVFIAIIIISFSISSCNNGILNDIEDEIPEEEIEIVYNPYENVDLSIENQYKAAFHVHIREQYDDESDIIKLHEDYGFDIFARTEKNEMTQPESDEMKIINAYESTSDQEEHSIVLFTEETGNYEFHDQEEAIQIRAHPHDPGRDKYEIEDMKEQFINYNSILGFEIISRNYSNTLSKEENDVHTFRRGKGNYIRSTNIWSKILNDSNVNRNDIFGFGVTDGYNNHNKDIGNSIYNTGWTRVVSNELNEENIKNSIQLGKMFYVSNMGEGEPPYVTDVVHDNNLLEIEISGDYEMIYWFYDNEVISKGEIFDLSKVPEDQRYIRFEVWTKESDYWPEKISDDEPSNSAYYSADIIGSQPFILNDF